MHTNPSTDNTQTVRAALSNTVANIIVLLFAMVMLPVTTHILDTADMGIAVSFFSIRSIGLNLFTLASYLAVNRGMLDFADRKAEFLSSLLIFNVISVTAFGAVCFCFRGFLSRLLGFPDFLWPLLFADILLWCSYTIGTTYLLYHNRYKLMFLINMCIGPVSQLFAVFLILHLPQDKYLGRIIGLDSFYMLIGLLMLVVFLAKGRLCFRREYLVYALGLTLPLVPHLLSQTLLSQSDIIMITGISGADKSGIYSMAYTIAMVLYSLLTQIMGVWSPWFYRQMEADNIQTIYRYSRVLFLFGLICSIGLMMIAPEAVRLFLAPSYHESIFLIPVLIIGMFFLFSYTFFYDVEYYYKKTKGIAVASLLAALENIVLNAIFIPVYGYVAAGFTTAVGYLTLMLLHFFFMKRLEKRRIYDMRTFALTCALLLVSAVFMYRTIDRPLIRYPAAILAILVILTALRKDLVQLLGVLRQPKEKD